MRRLRGGVLGAALLGGIASACAWMYGVEQKKFVECSAFEYAKGLSGEATCEDCAQNNCCQAVGGCQREDGHGVEGALGGNPPQAPNVGQGPQTGAEQVDVCKATVNAGLLCVAGAIASNANPDEACAPKPDAAVALPAPGGNADAVVMCVREKCAAECSIRQCKPDPTIPFFRNAGCDKCVAANACDAVNRCYGNRDCRVFVDCITQTKDCVAPPTPGELNPCVEQCRLEREPSSEGQLLAGALITAIATRCFAACFPPDAGVSPPDASSPATDGGAD